MRAEYKYTIGGINTHYNVRADGKFLVFTLFQFHSLGSKSISWYDFSIPIFFPVVAIQRDHRQAPRSFFLTCF